MEAPCCRQTAGQSNYRNSRRSRSSSALGRDGSNRRLTKGDQFHDDINEDAPRQRQWSCSAHTPTSRDHIVLSNRGSAGGLQRGVRFGPLS